MAVNSNGEFGVALSDGTSAKAALSFGKKKIDDGAFHHVAMVIDRETHRLLGYVDGEMVLKADVSRLPNAPYPGGDVYLGPGVYGQLDELTFYDRALTQDELQRVGEAGSAGKCVSPLVKPTDEDTPMTAVSASRRATNAAANTIAMADKAYADASVATAAAAFAQTARLTDSQKSRVQEDARSAADATSRVIVAAAQAARYAAAADNARRDAQHAFDHRKPSSTAVRVARLASDVVYFADMVERYEREANDLQLLVSQKRTRAELGLFQLGFDPNMGVFAPSYSPEDPPPPVHTITVVARNDRAIAIRWKNTISNDTQTEIQRLGPLGPSDWSSVATLGPQAEFGTFVDNDALTHDTRYCYRVRIRNAYGTSGFGAIQCAYTKDYRALSMWRVQVRIKVHHNTTTPAFQEDPRTRDLITVRLNSDSGLHWPNGNATSVASDGWFNRRFDLKLASIGATSPGDITEIQLEKVGSDGVCIEEIEIAIGAQQFDHLAADDAAFEFSQRAFHKVFGNTTDTCLWLDNENGHSRVHVISHQEIRNNARWGAFLENNQDPGPPERFTNRYFRFVSGSALLHQFASTFEVPIPVTGTSLTARIHPRTNRDDVRVTVEWTDTVSELPTTPTIQWGIFTAHLQADRLSLEVGGVDVGEIYISLMINLSVVCLPDGTAQLNVVSHSPHATITGGVFDIIPFLQQVVNAGIAAQINSSVERIQEVVPLPVCAYVPVEINQRGDMCVASLACGTDM